MNAPSATPTFAAFGSNNQNHPFHSAQPVQPFHHAYPVHPNHPIAYSVGGAVPAADDLVAALSNMAIGGATPVHMPYLQSTPHIPAIPYTQPVLHAHAPLHVQSSVAPAHPTPLPVPAPHTSHPASSITPASHVARRREIAKARIVAKDKKAPAAAKRRVRVAVAYRAVHTKDAKGNTQIRHVRVKTARRAGAAVAPVPAAGPAPRLRRVGALRRTETFLTSEFMDMA